MSSRSLFVGILAIALVSCVSPRGAVTADSMVILSDYCDTVYAFPRHAVFVGEIVGLKSANATISNPPLVVIKVDEVISGLPLKGTIRARWRPASPFYCGVGMEDLVASWPHEPYPPPPVGSRFLLAGGGYNRNREYEVFGGCARRATDVEIAFVRHLIDAMQQGKQSEKQSPTSGLNQKRPIVLLKRLVGRLAHGQ